MKYPKNKKCTLLAGIAVAVAIVLGAVVFTNEGLFGGKKAEQSEKSTKLKKSPKNNRKFRIKKRKDGSRSVVRTEIAVPAGRVSSGMKPELAFDDDEAKLSEEYRKLLKAVRDALDADNKRALLRLVQKVQAKSNWSEEVPSVVKSAMIDALGWFGSSCLAEIAGFMADSDEEIAQAAIEKYEEALSDFDLSDRERSKLLVMASQVITDPDAMDSMLFELNNMRHSVAVDTIKQLMASGGAATQTVLPDNIEFYTGEEGMNTPEKLDQWLKDNPDDEWDEEFYGGSSKQ